MARFRNVCFTLNNPEGLIPFNAERMRYLVYQEEIGESGTYHLQGYCEFNNQERQAAAKELLGGPSVHIDARRGTQAEAVDYCTKEFNKDGSIKRIPHTTPYTFGVPYTQGKRMDLESFKDEVIAGKRKRDLLDDHYGVIARYPKFYDTITMMNRPTRTVELEVTLLIGDTGTGKTRFVYDKYGGAGGDLFITPLNNGTMWWDTYDAHKVVLMDDFSGAACHMTLVTLLRLLDRYPVLAPIKGSYTWWLPEKIFVTTNILPKHWFKWENREEQYKALARRFTKVISYKDPNGLSQEDTAITEEDHTWWDENAPEKEPFINQ